MVSEGTLVALGAGWGVSPVLSPARLGSHSTGFSGSGKVQADGKASHASRQTALSPH